MHNFCFGLKLWSSNNDMLDDAIKLIGPDMFHYIELTPVPGTDIQPFKDLDVPYMIHITTERWGFNISDKSSVSISRGLLNNCIKWADELDAKYMIMHPGFEDIEIALKFLEIVDDPRILLENMPAKGLCGDDVVGSIPSEIMDLMVDKFGFCLDMNHAMKAAGSLSMNHIQLITEFLTLEPKMFHISDGYMEIPEDEHLHIGEGNYNFKEMLGHILKNKNNQCITLETPRETFADDLNNLSKLKKYIQ